MDYFEADVARCQMFTSDVIKARNVQANVSNLIYHKFSNTPNGKSVNVMLEFARKDAKGAHSLFDFIF